jgi:hypothetical protein
MRRTDRQDPHERYRELCALAQARSLGLEEQADLDEHLLECAPCRDVYQGYSLIAREGMPLLAESEVWVEEAQQWDDREVRHRLLSAVRNQEPLRVLPFKMPAPVSAAPTPPAFANRRWPRAAMAACLVAGLLFGAYHLGEHHSAPQPPRSATLDIAQHPVPASEEKQSVELAAAQTAQIARLEEQAASAQREVARLRAASTLAEKHAGDIGNEVSDKDAQLRQVSEERDRLATQLTGAEKAYQSLQADLLSLRAEHSQTLLHTASLESKVEDLTAATRDQDRRLKDDQQFLVSDRDVRELMGARKLYIADVFDVDGASRTRKPFGRVFYTQNKSLVFYAFDLDHQPGVKNASAFQVWGERDSDSHAEAHPMNLGILYMDSESNRRWVLRSDDPKQLAEIDAVFVTVEPHGGSQKPSGKPLLYALLRKEANHP